MKTITKSLKTLFIGNLAIFLLYGVQPVKAVITDNSWDKLPIYKSRQFWESLPDKIRQEYIKRAEGYLEYNRPVVKATDYLEFIRSGDRGQME